jgi:hypothetical protein
VLLGVGAAGGVLFIACLLLTYRRRRQGVATVFVDGYLPGNPPGAATDNSYANGADRGVPWMSEYKTVQNDLPSSRRPSWNADQYSFRHPPAAKVAPADPHAYEDVTGSQAVYDNSFAQNHTHASDGAAGHPVYCFTQQQTSGLYNGVASSPVNDLAQDHAPDLKNKDRVVEESRT